MKHIFILLISFVMLVTAAPAAFAAKPDRAGGGKPDKPSEGSTLIGYDVSYPQCDRSLPSDFAFAIVGVNGGLATTANRCLSEQLTWAQQANNSTPQSPVQLYVNTGNPWDDRIEYEVTTWPTDNVDQRNIDTHISGENPYGVCTTTEGNYEGYTNSEACSWQYGWERAIDDINTHFYDGAQAANVSSDPQDYYWWLDVEITNSWQTADPKAKDLNRITLEGMVDYFTLHHDLKVGIYSTPYQFSYIVGDGVPSSSNLYNLDSWLAGARNERDARSICATKVGLTPASALSLVQFVSKNLDHNVNCL